MFIGQESMHLLAVYLGLFCEHMVVVGAVGIVQAKDACLDTLTHFVPHGKARTTGTVARM